MASFVGDERKLAEMIVWAGHLMADDPAAGSTKLNKVLFYSDFIHHRRYGRPITGVEYQKLKHGPAPRRLLPIRNEMEERGDIVVRPEPVFLHTIDRAVPQREPNLDLFTDSEQEVVLEVIRLLDTMSAADASRLSHDEFGWNWVELGETIPYVTAFAEPEVQVTDHMRRRAAELTKSLGR
jgi:hypothetical protein